MKFCRQSYAVLFGFIICYSAADPIITTTSNLNGNGVFENSSEVTLICTIQPYTNAMVWRINSLTAADCLASSCNFYISGRYTFAFDPGNGIFNLTINVVTFDDNGTTFECYDGISTTELTAIVKEKKTSTDETFNGIGWWNEKKWYFIITGTVTFVVQIALAVVVICKRKQTENLKVSTVRAMEKKRNTKRRDLNSKLENRDKNWRKCIADIEEPILKIEKETEGNNKLSRPGERETEQERNLIQEEKQKYDIRTLQELQEENRLKIQSKCENELKRRKDEITKRYQQGRHLLNRKEKEQKLNEMHTKMEMQIDKLRKREKNEIELRTELERKKEEERKLQQTAERNQPNHEDKELTVEMMLEKKSTRLHTERVKREARYREWRENIEKTYSEIIKEEEKKLKQPGKKDEKENYGITNNGGIMSTAEDMENTLNEDKNPEYYRIKRKCLGIQRQSREMALSLEKAELEDLKDEFGGRKNEEDEGKLKTILVPQTELQREEQLERRLETRRIVKLRKELDEIEERHETKIKEKEEYLKQQIKQRDKNSNSCKRCLNNYWWIVWFFPIIGLLVLGFSMLVHCCKKCPQNKVDDSPKLPVLEVITEGNGSPIFVMV